jgi:O-acetyl-ADP-ribose deacetylase
MKTINSFTNLFKLGLKAAAMSSQATYADALVGDSGKLLRTYQLANNRCLTVVQGSVVDFRSTHGAIVNAANEGCLSGGGVDGALVYAGGPNLAEDRRKLPLLYRNIRCFTGDAKRTGPGNYGSLRVPYVIHAVGPDYSMYEEENNVDTPHGLLQKAYAASLDCTLDTPIQKVAFALLSAGIFRGEQSLNTVLRLGVESIRAWSSDRHKLDNSKLEDIVLYAFTNKEAKTLLRVCDDVLLDNSNDQGNKQPPSKQNEREKGVKEKEPVAQDPQEVKGQDEGAKGSPKTANVYDDIVVGGKRTKVDDGNEPKKMEEGDPESTKLKTRDSEPNDGYSSYAEQTKADKPAGQVKQASSEKKNHDKEDPNESKP